MSAIAIGGHGHAPAQARGLQASVFRPHRRDAKAGAATESITNVGKPGQLPAGSGSALLSGAVKSLLGSTVNTTA